MTIEYITFCNLLLLTRLIYIIRDNGLEPPKTIALMAVQAALALIIFQWNWTIGAAIAVVTVLGVIAILTAQKLDVAKGYRLLSLLVLFLVPAYLASRGAGFVFHDWVINFAIHLGESIPFVMGMNHETLNQGALVVFGFLLLANETNIGIRAVFHHLKLEPKSTENSASTNNAGDIDEGEYNAGRVIGIVERWLMFLVVLVSDDLSALAFIIAAKGLARMKQLDEKEFAEYMLVGTLLSALSAVLIGFYIKNLIGAI